MTALHPIEASLIQARRERVFLLLAGLFLGTLAMLNVFGISRFIVLLSLEPTDAGTLWSWGQWSSHPGAVSFALAIGVLPYPLTFLCTDFICEFYGRRRANWVVTVGLILNLWVIFIIWLAGVLPEVPAMDPQTGLPPVENLRVENGRVIDADSFAFYRIRALTFGAVTASMIAYLAAQFCDVFLFHFWKRVTGGKHLWLRNNGSTLISQLVDTIAVILITHFYAQALPAAPEGRALWAHLSIFIITGYAFKFAVAVFDTIPFYLGCAFLRRYLHIDPQAHRKTAD